MKGLKVFSWVFFVLLTTLTCCYAVLLAFDLIYDDTLPAALDDAPTVVAHNQDAVQTPAASITPTQPSVSPSPLPSPSPTPESSPIPTITPSPTPLSKIAYLTFDDGPNTKCTYQVLDILDKNSIKATFFLIGSLAERNPDVVKDIYDRGHAIGNHSYTHDYAKVYASADSFINEVVKTKQIINDALGFDYDVKLFRYPGGLEGGKYATAKKNYLSILEEEGYANIGWSSLNGDSEKIKNNPEKMFERFTTTVGNQTRPIILMHDGPSDNGTVSILQRIIDYLVKNGYGFDVVRQ